MSSLTATNQAIESVQKRVERQRASLAASEELLRLLQQIAASQGQVPLKSPSK